MSGEGDSIQPGGGGGGGGTIYPRVYCPGGTLFPGGHYILRHRYCGII